MTMKRYLFLLMLCASASALATNYKWTDAHGEVHYSDTPPPKGTDVKTLPSTSPEGGIVKEEKPGVALDEKSEANTQLMDANAVPYLKDEGRTAYRDFIKHSGFRAFLVCPDASFSAMFAATQVALNAQMQKYLADRGAQGCRPYVINNHIVW